jgi:hypothetical protein
MGTTVLLTLLSGRKYLLASGLRCCAISHLHRVIYLAIWYFSFAAAGHVFGQLKPCDPKSKEEGSTLSDWVGVGLAPVLMVFFGSVCVLCLITAQKGIEKLKEIRKTGNLDGYEIPASRDDDNCEA